MQDLNHDVNRLTTELETLKQGYEADVKALEVVIQQQRNALGNAYRQREIQLNLALRQAQIERARNTPLQQLIFAATTPKPLRDIEPGLVVTCPEFAYVRRYKQVTYVSNHTEIKGIEFYDKALLHGDGHDSELDESLMDAAFVIIEGGRYEYSANMNGSGRDYARRFEARQIQVNPATGEAAYNPNSELFYYDSNAINGAKVMVIGHVTNAVVPTFKG